MAKAFQPVVLTANALEGGEAVWWTGAGWSPRFDEARVAADAAQSRALAALGAAPLFESVVVGPYLAPVTVAQGAARPGSRREAIRAAARPTFDYLLEAAPRHRDEAPVPAAIEAEAA